MITFSAVTCPKCQEWRVTMITEIVDPIGKRYYCCCCGHEFGRTPAKPATAQGAGEPIGRS